MGLCRGQQVLVKFCPGKIPDDASIMLKNDNDEVLLTGAEYKIMSKEVKAPGTNYSKTRDIIETGRYRAGQAAQQRFLDSLEQTDDDEDKDEGTKYSLTKQQLDDYAKSYSGVTDFSFDGGDMSMPAPKPSGSPPPLTKPSDIPSTMPRESSGDGREGYEGSQYDFSSPTEKSTREDRFGEAGKFMKDGGWQQRKNPKPKR